MAAKNLYAVLGVDDLAGPEELRRAWLRLAVKFHPDRNPGNAKAEERFKVISQAYAVLSDPAARARYDRGRPKPAGAKAGGPRAARPEEPRRERPAEKPRPEEPRPEGLRPEGHRPNPEKPQDWTETLNAFFQTPKGRDTLKELEEELRRAGLKFSSGRLARWLQARRRSVPGTFLAWLEDLAAWRPGGPARARRGAARYDIGYGLALPPEAAARETTVEISYPLDGRPRELKVCLPAGLRNGARLRLPDQGRLRPDGGRGDLLLTILIHQG